MLSADFSLTDKSTWLALLSLVAAVCSDIFHQSFAPYVAPAATLAAGVVVAVVALSKHHYAAALSTAIATIPAAQAQAPVLPQPVTDALAVAKTALDAVVSLSVAPLAVPAPVSAPEAAPVAVQAAPPAPAAPATV